MTERIDVVTAEAARLAIVVNEAEERAERAERERNNYSEEAAEAEEAFWKERARADRYREALEETYRCLTLVGHAPPGRPRSAKRAEAAIETLRAALTREDA